MGLIIVVHIIRFTVWLLKKLRFLKKTDGESRIDRFQRQLDEYWNNLLGYKFNLYKLGFPKKIDGGSNSIRGKFSFFRK